MSLTLDRVVARLAAHRASEASKLFKRSAVAVVLRFEPRPQVLLIERAAREGDRWSGHVAVPGGLESAGDADLQATAMREAHEEVGLRLDGAGRLLGRLDPLRAIAKGKWLPMTITPFVFHLTGAWTPLMNAEVASWFWLPLDEAAAGRLDDRYDHKVGPVGMTFPCWRYDGRVVWGLTYQMLRAVLERVG